MKVLFLFGDAAVGKMTVGQELTKITDLRLFHNHMTIEPVLEIFGDFNGDAIYRMREVIFEEFAKTDKYGLIFTFMWAFDQPDDWKNVEHIQSIFTAKNKDTQFYYAELVAPQDIRLQRNTSENRLKHKKSKNDIETSTRRLLDDDAHYRLESLDGEIPFENYIKIDNSDLPAAEAAQKIKERFGF